MKNACLEQYQMQKLDRGIKNHRGDSRSIDKSLAFNIKVKINYGTKSQKNLRAYIQQIDSTSICKLNPIKEKIPLYKRFFVIFEVI
ncbi:MAG: hypothetical protein ACQESP_08600 [Candidatus Muiribacteriota bacterium]